MIGFLCGAVPFGYLAGRWKGIDIRTLGSGNIGATNVLRTLGKKWGIAVFIADMLKGFLPVLAAAHLPVKIMPQDLFIVLVGMACLLGHMFTPFLKFKGGKGVATSAGVLLSMMPIPLGIAAVVWGVVFYAFKYVSLASIVASVVLPALTLVFYKNKIWFIVVAVAMGVLVILRHRSNIRRLLSGTENKFGKDKK